MAIKALGVDGAHLRAARVLLPRDRPQPARRRPVRASRAWCSSTTSPTSHRARPIMLSAHGSAPEVVAAARARGSYVVDSVCPLVTKVHHEVKVRAEQGLPHRLRRPRGPRGGGRHDGGRARRRSAVSRPSPRSMRCPQFDRAGRTPGPDDALPPRLAGRRRCRHSERYPDAWTPGRSDLCFATTNRQSALMAMAPRCDAIVVIGSANSSNTRALEKLAIEAGMSAGVPRQPRRRAARRPARHGRRHRRRIGSRGARRRGDPLPRPAQRCRAGEGHRRGRVLPAAAQHPRTAGGDRRPLPLPCSAASVADSATDATITARGSDVLAALHVPDSATCAADARSVARDLAPRDRRGRRGRRRAGRAPARRGCSSSPRWCRPRSSWPGCAGTPSAACSNPIAVSGRIIS